MTATTRSLTAATVTRYAIGSLGTGGFATLPGLVLVFYLTDTLGIAALWAGLLVTVAKIWDVIIDPVIGAQSDRALAMRGSRRGMMLLGALGLPLFFALTFGVPAGIGPLASGIWVMLAFLATATAFSLFQVPYIALPAEIAPDYDSRTRLLSWRVVVLTFAILLFGAGGPMLRELGGDNENLGYLVMAVIAGVVIGAGMLLSSFVAPRSPADTPIGAMRADAAARTPFGVRVRANYTAGIETLKRSQPFRALLATFVLQGLATGLMLASANYVAVWVLESELALTLLFVALIAPALLCAPLWRLVADRVGKERGFRLATILFGVATAAMTALLWAPGDWVYLPVAVAGAGYAGMQALPMAMLPDVIRHDATQRPAAEASRLGTGEAGTFSGVWTAGETTGMALGATVLTITLALTGYRESVGAEIVLQSPLAIAGIVCAFSVVPAALIAVSLVTLGRYRLRKSDIDGEPATASEMGRTRE